jgi:hypothetical protein
MSKYPERLNTDNITYMSDAELQQAANYIYAELNRCHETKKLKYLNHWEEEICYVQRELSIRNSRLNAHSEYMKQLSLDGSLDEVDFYESDRDLPTFEEITATQRAEHQKLFGYSSRK